MDLESPGALINTEILAKSTRSNASYVEIGVHHYPRQSGESSGGSPRVVFRAMKETILLWLRMRSYVPVTRGNGQPHRKPAIGAAFVAAAGFGVAVAAGVTSKLLRRRRKN